MPESSGHSAFKSWQIYFNKAILKVAPQLGKKSNAQLVFSVVLIIIAVFGTIGFGIYLDGYVIHPPAQYTGVCPPPARIEKGGCYLTEVEQVTVSGTQTVTTVQIPSGTVLLSNGTKH
jgi:hypothetical protein